MRFDARVDAPPRWTRTRRRGTSTWTAATRYTCRFLITALGLLSAPTHAALDGMDTFQGPSFHTFDWPHEPLDLDGQARRRHRHRRHRGAGDPRPSPKGWASCTCSSVAPTGARRCTTRRSPPEEMARIKASYDEIFEQCAATPGGFMHGPDRRKLADVPREERLGVLGAALRLAGVRHLAGQLPRRADGRRRQRRVLGVRGRQDPPAGHRPGRGREADPERPRLRHPAGADGDELLRGLQPRQRPPGRPLETPIERITPTGVRTADRTYEVDVIVYATGFDAITGSFDRIDFIGVDGAKLRDEWARRARPRTSACRRPASPT